MTRQRAQEMTIIDYARVLARRRWVVLLGIVAAVAPATVLTAMQQPLYSAEARMLVQSQNQSVFGSSASNGSDADRNIRNEINVLEGDVVLARVKQDLGLTVDPPRVAGTAIDQTDVVSVTVASSDPDTAALLANAYVNAYIETRIAQTVESMTAAEKALQSKISDLQKQIDDIDAKIAGAGTGDQAALTAQRQALVDQQSVFKQRLDQLQIDTSLTGGSASVVQPATAPTNPIEPTPVKTVGLALGLGLVLGLVAAFVIDFLDDSLRTPDDAAAVAGEVPVLAVVPSSSPPDNRPIALSRQRDPAVEIYRTLRTTLQFLGFERSMHVLQVTSSSAGEGKTTTAANLAVVLSQTGSKVVLVDADLRKPRVHQVFALDGTFGLTDNLLGTSLHETERTIDEHLTVITCGAIPPHPSEMLSGKRMVDIIAELREQYDYVILDSAPTLPVSDAVALSRHVDGVLVVVQAKRTSSTDLEKTLADLEQVSAPVVGIVLNRARVSKSGGYGYGYGTA